MSRRKDSAGQANATLSRHAPGTVCAGLVLFTAAIYSHACSNEFVNIDDTIYATENYRVSSGLTFDNVRWALTSLEHANWHPLTWLSLQTDATLFGKNAAAFHATNVVLHVVNTALLFWVLYRASGTLAASGLVAALFALHPLHVESVAWVAERKDVLSTMFWLLTMLVYERYATRKSIGWYLATVSFFVIGLAAKPMLVTLPFVLLLWDFWPLRRLGLVPSRTRLILEKVPLLLFSVLNCVIAIAAQHRMGAMPTVEALSIGKRLQHVPLAYVEYLSKMFFPRDLAVYYPYGYLRHDIATIVSSVLCLALVSLWALCRLRRQPYLAVGWLWYVGTLIPVIGMVQVGGQAIADRYTYIPSIGIFIAIVWAAGDLVRRLSIPRYLSVVASGSILVLLASLTWQQIGYWHDSVTLWQHASAISAQDPKIYASIGGGLVEQQRYAEALRYLSEALKAGKDDGSIRTNIGVALFNLGQFHESEEQFDRAIELDPENTKAFYNLGCARLLLKNPAGAIAAFEETLINNPHHWQSHLALAETLANQGAGEAAQAHFERAVEIDRQGALASWRNVHPNAVDAAALAEQIARARDAEE